MTLADLLDARRLVQAHSDPTRPRSFLCCGCGREVEFDDARAMGRAGVFYLASVYVPEAERVEDQSRGRARREGGTWASYCLACCEEREM